MRFRHLFPLFLFASLGLTAGFAQTDIGPYASEADLGKLIGQKAKVEGVFHPYAFNAPAVVISGRVFYILENPPTQRPRNLGNESSYGTVTGTLYLYDGGIQFSEDYEKVGRRYYFFSLADARLDLGDPLREPGESPAVVPRGR